LVKSIKAIAIAFPIIIALCIPFRVYVLPKLFTEEELIMLDSDETAIQNWLAAKEKLAEPEDDDHHYDAPLLQTKPVDTEPLDVADLINLSHDEDEHRDSLAPLPVLGDGSGSYASSVSTPRRRTRPRRVKSVSCPTSGSLFGETFPIEEVCIRAHAPDHVEVEATIEEEALPTNVAADEEVGGTTTTPTLRRRRKKTVSCPPHMLFSEAERHMNANYFFG
jgi:hypothetical protein